MAGRVLVLPEEQDEMTKGGIVLPEEHRKNQPPTRGTIIAIGPPQIEWGVEVPIYFSEGELALYNQYAGTEMEDGDHKFLMLKHSDIVATEAADED